MPKNFDIDDMPEAKTMNQLALKQWQLLWELNYTPLSLMKLGGAFGAKKLINSWTRYAVKMYDAGEIEVFNTILHQTCCRQSSSEVSLTRIVNFGSWAREPLCHILPQL